MIELINDNGDVIKVPSGARKFYESQGFTPVSPKVNIIAAPEVAEVEAEESKFKELLEKPIGQWKKAEVIEFAEANGIDISGTKNINEAKSIIKDFIDKQAESEDWD